MWQVLVLVVLLAIMSGLGFVIPADGATPSLSLAATGFILLAAWTLGTLFRRIKLPALLGYLVAGIAFGPKLARLILGDAGWALFDDAVIGQLALVNTLAVGVIGTIGGGELKISDLRRGLKETLAISVACFVVTLPLVTGVVLAIARGLPQLMPFLEGATFENQLAVALLLAILACGMSPAATIALLQDVKAKGNFTTLVLGIVVIADLMLVALFLLLVALAQTLISPDGFQIQALIDLAPAILAEFGWALVIGVVAGALFILYLRFVKRELLLFAVGMIFAVSFVSQALHAETLLAFLTAGFVVQNLSRHGHTLIHALEKISLPVFVVYFMTQAASLDLVALNTYLPLTLALVATRCTAFFGSIRLAARLVNANEDSQRYLWLCFFSQGGVDLVLASIIANRIPSWGHEVQTIVTATVITYIVGGPPLLKLALERTGETAEARARQQDQAATFKEAGAQTQVELRDAALTFEPPDAEDEALQRRLLELRDELERLTEAQVAGPAEEAAARAADLSAAVLSAAEELLHELDALEGLEPDPARVRVRELHRQLLGRLPGAALRGSLEPLPVTIDALEQTLEQLQALEPFQAIYTVPREAFTREAAADDGRLLALVKQLRRLRHAALGPGERAVPLGRLWRFYVALELPQRFARVRFDAWAAWWLSLHRVLGLLDAHAAALLAEDAATPGALQRATRKLRDQLAQDHRSAQQHAEHDDHHEHPAEHPAPSPQALTAAALRAALDALRDDTARLDELPLQIRRAVAGAWNRLLDATRRAGGVELPTWSYGPSRAFDRARGAQSSLRDQLQGARLSAGAARDDAALQHALLRTERFGRDFATHAARAFGQALARRALGPLQRSLDLVQSALTRLKEQRLPSGDEPGDTPLEDAWRLWLQEVALPNLEAAEQTLIHASERAEQRTQIERRVQSLDRHLAEHPAVLTLSAEVPPARNHPDHVLADFQLQTWLRQELGAEVGVALDDATERLRQIFLATQDELAQLDQILRYHALTAQQSDLPRRGESHEPGVAPLEATRSALERAADRLEHARSRHVTDARALEDHLLQRLDALLHAALDPLAERQLDAIRRQMERRADPRPRRALLTAALQLAERGGRALQSTVRPFARREWQSLTRTLRRTPEATTAPEASTPPIYRRLFARLHLDAHQLQQALPGLDRELGRTLEAWRAGQPASTLLVGEAGHNPASLAHTLLATRVEPDALHLASPGADAQDEGELVAALRPADAPAHIRSFDQLQRLLLSRGRPLIVLIDGLDPLLLPTPPALRHAAALLDLVEATAGAVLWLLPLTRPLLDHLDPVLHLQARVQQRVEVPPLDRAHTERFLRARHQLSGYRLAITPTPWTFAERLLAPLQTRAADLDPERAFFDQLHRLSGGDLGQATHLWIQQADLVAQEDASAIVLRPLPAALPDPAEGLSDEALLLVTALLRHQRLRTADLPTLLHLTPQGARRATLELLGRRLLARLPGQDTLALHPSALYGVTWGLRRRRLIA